MISFLQDHSLLSNWQTEFWPNYSTATALTYVSDQILQATDTGKLTGVIYLFLKKAFDTVDHGLLLSKLKQLGLIGTENKWMRSYLTNRNTNCSNK